MFCIRLLCLLLALSLASFGQATPQRTSAPAGMSCCAGGAHHQDCPGCPAPSDHQQQQCCIASAGVADLAAVPHSTPAPGYVFRQLIASSQRYPARCEPPRLPPPKTAALS